MEASISFLNNNEVQSIEKKASDILTQASGLVVTDHEQEQVGIEFIKGIKALKKAVEETFGPIKKKTHEAWKESVAQEKRHLEPLEAAEKMVRGKVVCFQDEQERLRRAEQAKLEEVARKEQQKRLDVAAKKVNTLLEKSTDLNGQIADLEIAIIASIDDTELTAIEAKLNLLRAKRDALEQAVYSKQVEVEQALYAVPTPIIGPSAPKIQGASSRVKKKAVIQNPMALIKAVAAGTVPLGVITFDMGVLDKLVNAGAIIPGVVFTEERSLTVR